ncbi:MAG: vanadium-dependent haloperoxidase [Isosphaeraceae bacterium]
MSHCKVGVEALEGRALLSASGWSSAPGLAVSAEVDGASDPLGNGTLFSTVVGVHGETVPGAIVTVGKGPGLVRVRADARGHFEARVGTPYGPSTIPVVAHDGQGHVGTASIEVTRGNAVLAWNAAALEAIRREKTPPPKASRALAILEISVDHAVTAATPAGDPAARAAATGAGYAALVALFPKEKPLFDAAADPGFEGRGPVPGRGEVPGPRRATRRSGLSARAHDGSDAVVAYTPGTADGQWRPTPEAFAPALLPQWGGVTPFVLHSGSQFRPAPPPALDSAEYAQALAEVQSLGRSTGSTRTADQTEIAQFWSDGAGTETPPGHWNTIAADVSMRRHDSLQKDARLFATLDAALADAGIACWDSKYDNSLWRPVTAIGQADPSWKPLLTTPPFPSYVSGHSTFSGAAATVLDGFFGRHVSFTSISDGLPGATRRFSSFDQAAAEAGQSRIYGGIHYAFDNTAGLALGRQIGLYALQHALKPART